MKLSIDREVCDGHGMCAQSAPDYVELDPDGDPNVITADVADDVPPPVELAVRACPVGAVHLQ